MPFGEGLMARGLRRGQRAGARRGQRTGERCVRHATALGLRHRACRAPAGARPTPPAIPPTMPGLFARPSLIISVSPKPRGNPNPTSAPSAAVARSAHSASPSAAPRAFAARTARQPRPFARERRAAAALEARQPLANERRASRPRCDGLASGRFDPGQPAPAVRPPRRCGVHSRSTPASRSACGCGFDPGQLAPASELGVECASDRRRW